MTPIRRASRRPWQRRRPCFKIAPARPLESVGSAVPPVGGARAGGFRCPHRFAEPCACKKPHGLLYACAAREHRIDIGESFVAGDTLEDVRAAQSLGAQGCLVRSGWAVTPEVVEAATPYASTVVASTVEAVDWILEVGRRDGVGRANGAKSDGHDWTRRA